MTGQMSLFDFIQDPEQEKKDRAKEWSAGRQIAKGYQEGIRQGEKLKYTCFADYFNDRGGITSGKCEKGIPDNMPKSCAGCRVYLSFYERANEIQKAGNPWGLSVALARESFGIPTVPEYEADAYRHGTKYDQELETWIPKNWDREKARKAIKKATEGDDENKNH